MDLIRSHVMVCGGTGCTSSNSGAIINEFETQLVQKGLDKEVKVVRTGCFGLCEAGPVVIVYPEGAFYSHVKVEDVTRIVDEHLIKGRIVKVVRTESEEKFSARGKHMGSEVTETISNKMIFNVLTPNGFKALT